MRYLFGLALSAALALGTASDAKAQFSLSVGNPYMGQGVFMGSNVAPYGYGGYGYAPGLGLGPGYSTYSRGYYGLGGLGAAPLAGGVYGYNSGYYGAPAVFGVTAPVYPTYGYRYGYRPGLGVYRPFFGRRYYRW